MTRTPEDGTIRGCGDSDEVSTSPGAAGRVGATLRGVAWRGRARQVRALLEEERELILRGDLRALAGLAARSRTALEDLVATPTPPDASLEPELERIRGAAIRNRRLLAALLEGAAEARRELASHEIARNRLGYDRAGAPVASATGGRGNKV